MTKKLSELIYEMAEQEFGEHPHDEPYKGAGYCVCDYCQKLAPAAIALENEVARLRSALEAVRDPSGDNSWDQWYVDWYWKVRTPALEEVGFLKEKRE